MVGARKDYGRQALLPHNAVYVLLGAGLLWFGWFGFNGGSGFSTGEPSVLAFTNTLLTPACALIIWFVLDLIRGRKVTAIGAATAIIVGCVLITPAGGFISPGWAMVLGFLGALPCYAVIVWRPRTRVDETLDVLAAHGIAGFTGILFIGFVAADRLERGRRRPLLRQRRPARRPGAGGAGRPALRVRRDLVLLRLIGAVMPLRASEHDEAVGMDVVDHGEEAYAERRGRDPGRCPRPTARRSSSPTRMTEYVQVLTTVSSEAEAERSPTTCSNGASRPASRWSGRSSAATAGGAARAGREWQCLAKTEPALYEQVEAAIREATPTTSRR